MPEATAEAVVIGAGVMGASIAFHLAEKGIRTLVVDRQGPAAGPTSASGAIIRCHYTTPLEADLAWKSLTDYFEHWGERVGGGCGFVRTGFAFAAGEKDEEALRHNVGMLRDTVGIQTTLLSPEELGEIDPSVSTADLSAVAYEPRSGYADPTATTVSLVRAAERLGARFEQQTVVSLLEREGRIVGVRTEEKDIEAGAVFLAAGPWSASLAQTVGLDLPISSSRVQVALFQRPTKLKNHLALSDAPNHSYLRPAAESLTLVGSRSEQRQWLADPDDCTSQVEPSFITRASTRAARRLPDLNGASYVSGRSSVVDVTPDFRPILGPAGPEGLYLSAGWSGAGFKKAPAVGRELASWFCEGAPRRQELRSYQPYRFRNGKEIVGDFEYATTGPH